MAAIAMDKRLKMLTYRSYYRGTKEGDFILAPYFKNMAETNAYLDDNHYKLYCDLLDYPDDIITQWVVSHISPPKKFDRVIEEIQTNLGLINAT